MAGQTIAPVVSRVDGRAAALCIAVKPLLPRKLQRRRRLLTRPLLPRKLLRTRLPLTRLLLTRLPLTRLHKSESMCMIPPSSAEYSRPGLSEPLRRRRHKMRRTLLLPLLRRSNPSNSPMSVMPRAKVCLASATLAVERQTRQTKSLMARLASSTAASARTTVTVDGRPR